MAEGVRRSHHAIEIVTGDSLLSLTRTTDVDGATFFDVYTQESSDSADASISREQAEVVYTWLGEQLGKGVS
jgi:hypothetical protein